MCPQKVPSAYKESPVLRSLMCGFGRAHITPLLKATPFVNQTISLLKFYT